VVDESSKEMGSPPDPGRARRAPPTIDLAATEVSEARNAAKDAANDGAKNEAKNEAKDAGDAQPEAAPQNSSPAASSGAKSSDQPSPAAAAAISPPISPWVIAPISGAVAAALVIAVGWMLGWPAVQVASGVPQINASAIDDLTARVTSLEQKVGKQDSAAGARIDALDKSLTALRGDLGKLRAQSDKLAADATNAKSAQGESVAALDLSTLNERIDQIERASRTQSAREGENNKPADDMPLRRVVSAALLDVAVQQGHSFPALLTTAKSLAQNPEALKPLEPFAATGVPNPPLLSRELLTLVPKLSPPADNATSGSGIVDRLQAGASKLVRVERTDTTGNDRAAIVARVTAAALRNDFAEARRELNTLSPADRAPAQAWLDKADARDAALAASRQFAADAMTVLAKPGQ